MMPTIANFRSRGNSRFSPLLPSAVRSGNSRGKVNYLKDLYLRHHVGEVVLGDVDYCQPLFYRQVAIVARESHHVREL